MNQTRIQYCRRSFGTMRRALIFVSIWSRECQATARIRTTTLSLWKPQLMSKCFLKELSQIRCWKVCCRIFLQPQTLNWNFHFFRYNKIKSSQILLTSCFQGTYNIRNFSLTDKFVIYPSEAAAMVEMRFLSRFNGMKSFVKVATVGFYGSYKYPKSPWVESKAKKISQDKKEDIFLLI